MKAADICPGDTVKAISLWEPSATLMALGLKTIETRHWPTSYRGPLLICAAKRSPRLNAEAFIDWWRTLDSRVGQRFLAILGAPGAMQYGDVIDKLSPGHAVALVDLERCLDTDTSWVKHDWLDKDERPFGDFSTGRFGWTTTGLRRLKPFPVTGRQGLFNVTMPEFTDHALPES